MTFFVSLKEAVVVVAAALVVDSGERSFARAPFYNFYSCDVRIRNCEI